jgi:TPR repeat protein
MCQDGRGAAKDTVEAYKWFKLSADQGDAIGVRYAREYVEKALLTPEEFTEANRRIAEFRAHPKRSGTPLPAAGAATNSAANY